MDDISDRPIHFLVSTTSHMRDLARGMGCADYSYGFVLKGLIPVLESLGTWERVEHPESSLAFRAEETRASGRRPIHLALHPPQNVYLTPAALTVVFPFWEFPDVPDRDFANDTRQNWVRVCGKADLIVSACRFTADAFQRAGIDRPIAVVPVPQAARSFEVADWDMKREVVLHCRHATIGQTDGFNIALGKESSRPSISLTSALRAGFRRHVRPWLSEEARQGLARVRQNLSRQPAQAPPLLDRTDLTLSGLVYTSIFNLGDRRKNVEDIFTAFLLAFRDDEDATLVLKLATNPTREFHDLNSLRNFHRALGIDHACRVVALTDYLTDEQMSALMLGTTYYVNASRAEGACLPLQEALAGGRPAIAPSHTAMADYIDDRVAFVVDTDPEPTFWPHDPDRRAETTWGRVSWSSLREAFIESAATARSSGHHYAAMARESRRRIDETASLRVAVESFRRALALLPSDDMGSLDWAA